jgi:hypothetical protein
VLTDQISCFACIAERACGVRFIFYLMSLRMARRLAEIGGFVDQ